MLFQKNNISGDMRMENVWKKNNKMKILEKIVTTKTREFFLRIIFSLNLFDLGGCDNLIKKGYVVENLMDFPGH